METDEQAWHDKFEEVKAKIRAWQQARPDATLTEIEEAVEVELARLRRQIVEDLTNEVERTRAE